MKSATLSSKTYSVLMFIAVSILSGLLLSGLAVPFVALTSSGTHAVANAIDSLPSDFKPLPNPQRSRILMKNGDVLATFYAENREYVKLERISEVMQKAQVAIEDHRFFEHGAIDGEGLLRAIVKNIAGGSEGASTLTQQYVKMARIEAAQAEGDREGVNAAVEATLERKIIEARAALSVEERFTKHEILERYLNIAYYGDGAYGVQAAAQHYFGVNADQLDLAQSAMLAGIVQNPAVLSPAANPKAAIERRNVVLNRMASTGAITKEEAETAKQVTFDPAQIKTKNEGCPGTRYPFLCDYIKRTILSDKMAHLGATPEERENQLRRGGLTIYTQIDPKAMDATQAAINDQIAPTDPVLSGAVLLRPRDGMIIAMAQSRPVLGEKADAGETWWNINVESSLGGAEGYQAGSTFKVFAIAAGLEQGMTPGQSYDSPASVHLNGWRFRSCAGTETYRESHKVGNNGGATYGSIDMRKGTASSVNTYFMQLVRDVGLCETAKMAERAGIKLASGENVVEKFGGIPSFVLGAAEVTPMSVAQAYATFANRGVRCDPIIIEKIVNSDGQNIEVPPAKCERVMEESVADGVSYVLRSVVENGTGRQARMSDGRPQAGKTGTIDASQAVWFAGYTPELAGVAMIAIDKTHSYYETHRKSLQGMRLPSGTYLRGSGGGDAGLIWKSAMTSASKDLPRTDFGEPSQSILEGVKVALPDVSGMSLEQAKVALEDLGFRPIEWGTYSDQPPGTFLGISPSDTANKFSTIQLRVSVGPPPPPAPSPAPSDNASPAPSESGTPEAPPDDEGDDDEEDS